MTQEQQAARAKELQRLLDNLNNIPSSTGLKGKRLITSMRSYVCGWIDGKDGTPDPIPYYAITRGGDPRVDIEAGIKLITENNCSLPTK